LPRPYAQFPRIISDYCRQRIAPVFPPREAARIEKYLLTSFFTGERPPEAPNGWAWIPIAAGCDIDIDLLRAGKNAVIPILVALKKEIDRAPYRKTKEMITRRGPSHPNRKSLTTDPVKERHKAKPRKRHGPPPRPSIEFPPPLWDVWDEPTTFHEALALHMRRHGDTTGTLHRAICQPDENLNKTTISAWRRGLKAPQTIDSLRMLTRIEKRYRLPTGYFKAKLPHPSRAATGHNISGISPSERRRLAWHLPDDFDMRPIHEQEEILRWVRETIISGATEYRRFQAAAMKNRYGVRFRLDQPTDHTLDEPEGEIEEEDKDPDLTCCTLIAPQALAEEMNRLIGFKTSTLTAIGYQRNGVWGPDTAAQKIEHLGLLFGALTAHPTGPVRGFGVPLSDLSFSHLVFPAVWDWYLRWREQRRGFYTSWECNMLQIAAALTRQATGWLRQTSQLSNRLKPIRGLVSSDEIDHVRNDWNGACERLYLHALVRLKEIERVSRVHRDPFEPILPVLEADSPLGEYRKIVDEIIRLMPNERRYPISTAESVRSILLIRLGLHTGLRQRNLRQLLICPRDQTIRSERQLADQRAGELRWNVKDNGWEIFIPAIAFKNANSSFFSKNPFRLRLPDLGALYNFIEIYLNQHRPRLLRGAQDSGTFFVKTVKSTSQDAAYDQNTFYEAWRLIIQRYGIYNPYTGRGAIKGLLPHGPHNVRDVLATHVLKQTGSYEQASYAIQDTPEMVAKHYGRFLPQDKVALAAQVLNRVWEAA
jgi:hypothetical protein